eukprot:6481216-Amphidinium_carterae.2
MSPLPTPMPAFPMGATAGQPTCSPAIIVPGAYVGAFPGMPSMHGYQQPCIYWMGAADPQLPGQLWAGAPGFNPWQMGKDVVGGTVAEQAQYEIVAKSKRRGSRKSKKAAAAAASRSGSESWTSYMDSEGHDDDSDDCPFVAFREKWGKPIWLCEEEKLAAEVKDFATACDAEEQHALVSWLLPVIKPLALSQYGTHVVQQLLDSATKADKERITDILKPCIHELYLSAHGNHTLAKVVEQLPSGTVQFIVREFLGNAREVARHQYGCRIFERLIEHCPDQGDMSSLLDEIVVDAEPLCRHPFGNFVVQHLLEHGSVERRSGILRQVDFKLPALAMHRTASHFVQQLLDYSDQDTQRVIVGKLLHSEGPETLLQVAGSRYGSYVIEQLANLEDCYDEVREAVQRVVPFFRAEQLPFARRVISRYEL